MDTQTHDVLPGSRQILLKGDEELFAKYGFDGASFRFISKELGINSSMINYYFGTKESLYLQIFRNRLIEIADEISRFDQLDLEPGKKLEAYLMVYISRISTNQSFHRLLYNQLASQRNQVVLAMVSEARSQIYQFVLKIIRNGINTGDFKPVDAEIFALNILSFIPSVLTGNLTSLIYLDGEGRDDIAVRMINYILLTIMPGHLTKNDICHV